MRRPQILTVAGAVVTLTALAFATWSMLQARHLNTRLRAAQVHADSAWSWMSAYRDSMARGGTAPPPPYAAGSDSAWSASAREHFWHEQAMEARAAGNTMLGKGDIEALHWLGLQDPAADLRRDLAAHRELIPYHSSEGGFQFFPEMAILLPGAWVCAYFEDGMVAGHLILRYKVLPGGKIVWERLDGHLD